MSTSAQKAELAPLPPRSALDIMAPNVVYVSVEMTVGEVARVLVENRISAAPVVNGSGELVGIVSEGDLLGRNEEDRVAGRDWCRPCWPIRRSRSR